MNTDTKVVAENAAEETAQTSSPQVEESTVETQTQQTQQNVEPALPADVEEQRKAFQDMRIRNKQLEEELERVQSEREGRIQNESAFDKFRQPTQPVGIVDINQFADPTTGEVNWNQYNLAVQQNASAVAQTQAQKAVKEQLDEYQARSKYPEVFKDKTTEEEIAAKYLYRKLNGYEVSIEEIAAEVAKGRGKALEKAAREGAEQALTELTPKEQASLQAQGQTSSASRQALSDEEEAMLRIKTRQGDDAALTARMARVK